MVRAQALTTGNIENDGHISLEVHFPFGDISAVVVMSVCLADVVRPQGFSPSRRWSHRALWLCFAPQPPIGFSRSTELFPRSQSWCFSTPAALLPLSQPVGGFRLAAGTLVPVWPLAIVLSVRVPAGVMNCGGALRQWSSAGDETPPLDCQRPLSPRPHASTNIPALETTEHASPRARIRAPASELRSGCASVLPKRY